MFLAPGTRLRTPCPGTGLKIFIQFFRRPQIPSPHPTVPTFPSLGHVSVMDLPSLEVAVQQLFELGIASSTRSSYATTQKCYLHFCSSFGLSPLPLTEHSLCLFAAFLANHSLQASSIMAYLSAVRQLQISVGLPSPTTDSWPWLHYVIRDIKRSRSQPQRVCLPIATSILKQLHSMWFSDIYGHPCYKAKLLWAGRPPHSSASSDSGSYYHP